MSAKKLHGSLIWIMSETSTIMTHQRIRIEIPCQEAAFEQLKRKIFEYSNVDLDGGFLKGGSFEFVGVEFIRIAP